MRKIWYAIERTIEVNDDATDDDVEIILDGIASGNDYVWDDKCNLLDELHCDQLV